MKLLSNELMRDKTKPNKIAQIIPSIENPVIKESVNKIIKTFKTNAKRPKVTILIGKVRIKRIGFIKALTTPKTNATINAVLKESI